MSWVVCVWLFIYLCIPVKYVCLWDSDSVCGNGFVCTCICVFIHTRKAEKEEGLPNKVEEVLQRSESRLSFSTKITDAHCPGLTVAPAASFSAVISAG